MSDETEKRDLQSLSAGAISPPLVTHLYTADPSAHVFNGALYIYPSHDIDGGAPFNDNGDHFCMEDYHVFRMDSPDSEPIDCGVALHVKDVPWAARQMWAPDAACKNGRYYLYFPAKRANGLFQIGVAVGDRPEGPFVAEPEAMAGSYSIDPAVYEDDDGAHYMYFGGIWGGQLQKYRDNRYADQHDEPAADQPALGARVARLGGFVMPISMTNPPPTSLPWAHAWRASVATCGSSPKHRVKWSSSTNTERRYAPAIMRGVISKRHGCTSIKASTISRTPPATLISSAMPRATTRTGRLPTRGRS